MEIVKIVHWIVNLVLEHHQHVQLVIQHKIELGMLGKDAHVYSHILKIA